MLIIRCDPSIVLALVIIPLSCLQSDVGVGGSAQKSKILVPYCLVCLKIAVTNGSCSSDFRCRSIIFTLVMLKPFYVGFPQRRIKFLTPYLPLFGIVFLWVGSGRIDNRQCSPFNRGSLDSAAFQFSLLTMINLRVATTTTLLLVATGHQRLSSPKVTPGCRRLANLNLIHFLNLKSSYGSDLSQSKRVVMQFPTIKWPTNQIKKSGLNHWWSSVERRHLYQSFTR